MSGSDPTGKPGRGKACLNCRRRKMRCDGVKPTCGPCSRRVDDCEYTDRPGPTRTQALEEHIAFLENRIRDLESPADASSSVFLADPYASRSEAQPLSPNQPDPDKDLQSSGQLLEGEFPSLPDCWWDMDEPPIQLRQILLDYFLPYSSIVGFFLNIPRFINSFYLPGPPGDPARPSPALLSAVYLIGLKLSSSERLKAYEPAFLARAVSHATIALAVDHPQKAKHAIQAEILLMHYFYWAGRFLEGRYHGNAAVSIAISLGSHKIRSSQGAITTPVAYDTIEEGERINAFWTTYFYDQCWSVAMNLPSALPDPKALNGRIDAPWPLDMPQYEKGMLTPDVRGYDTVQKFVKNPSTSGEERSLMAASCKAAALLGQATRLASTFKQNLPENEFSASYTEYLTMNIGIETLYAKIPKFVPGDVNVHAARLTVLTHTILRTATIHLNVVFARQESAANAKCVEAAIATAHSLDEVDWMRLAFGPTTLGNMWLTCGQVLIREIVRLRTENSPDLYAQLAREEELVKLLDKFQFVLLSIGAKVPVFRIQYDILSKAREEQL